MRSSALAGLSTATAFSGFTNIASSELTGLQQVYASPDDVDLYVGILSETRPSDALVGATAGYIIGEQFKALKTGDRFYFENQGTTTYTALSLAQLKHIRTLTLHKLLCDNFSGMTNVRKDFYFPTARVACSSLPAFNVSLFV